MASFSERYGYTKPNEIIIRERLTVEIQNSVVNWLTILADQLNDSTLFEVPLYNNDLDYNIWVFFLNEDISKFKWGETYAARMVVKGNFDWYIKLNMIEYILEYIDNKLGVEQKRYNIDFLNNEFTRHNFAYRIIGKNIMEITTEQHIKSIEEASSTDHNGVKTHLQTALQFMSAAQQEPNYRNSIKESISAVGAICREISGKNDLRSALSCLKNKGVIIHPQMEDGFQKLYDYTNDKTSGVRHEILIDGYSPTADDAIYMLVICSAFVNYLNTKRYLRKTLSI